MSRDGYLPPGCTEKDVDMSAPDYYEDDGVDWERAIYRRAPDGLGYDEFTVTCCIERMIEKGCKADVMELFDKLTERFRLNSFGG